MFLDDFSKRRVDILRHPFGIAADEKFRAFLEPFPDLGGVFLHPVLHINLLGLIARQGGIDAREVSFFFERREIVAVEIIRVFALRAEKEPRFSARPDRFAFLQKCAKRRDAGSRSDHDEWRVAVFRKMKRFRAARINRHRQILRAFGQESRRHSQALTAVTFVSNDVDDEMNGVTDVVSDWKRRNKGAAAISKVARQIPAA